MRNKLATVMLSFISLLLLSCSGMQVSDFRNTEPAFEPFSYFTGSTTGYGMFYDRSADVSFSFTVELTGTLESEALLRLDEVLKYDDGRVEYRTYRIEKLQADLFQLYCEDLVEPGTIEMAGSALNWKYTLLQDVNGTKRPLRFDDWMFRKSDSLVLNRARAHWHGIFVGELFMVIEKQKD